VTSGPGRSSDEAVRGYEPFKDEDDGCVRAVFHP
jgi:hypothetical protein